MLNFNRPADSKDSFDEPWKVLVYDTFCRAIMSTIMKVGDFKHLGITLHL